MRWSLKLGEIAGIGIFVHWTFSLILLYVAFVFSGAGLYGMLAGLLFTLAIFGCVVLHELGHALMARRFGIGTRDITLLPIGGVARLERMPEDPTQELLVAIAGPAVNVAIAAAVFGLTVVLTGLSELNDGFNRLLDAQVGGQPLLAALISVNLFLVVFNLLPAFPMDGGRVLRSLLARSMNYVRATQIAATVGQMMAVLFGIVGLVGIPGLMPPTPMLMLIALFVYLGAQEEAHMVQMRSILRGVPVREAMITRYLSLAEDDPLATAVAELIAGSQQDFPVERQGELIGVLPRSLVFSALNEGQREVRIGELMQRDFQAVQDYERLDDVFQRMRANNTQMMPVLRNRRLVGLITLENVGEWMAIQSALRQTAPPTSVSDVIPRDAPTR